MVGRPLGGPVNISPYPRVSEISLLATLPSRANLFPPVNGKPELPSAGGGFWSLSVLSFFDDADPLYVFEGNGEPVISSFQVPFSFFICLVFP